LTNQKTRNNELPFELVDEPGGNRILKGKALVAAGGLSIFVEGYGLGDVVVGLVLQDGKLQANVFNDINKEEPIAINLEGCQNSVFNGPF